MILTSLYFALPSPVLLCQFEFTHLILTYKQPSSIVETLNMTWIIKCLAFDYCLHAKDVNGSRLTSFSETKQLLSLCVHVSFRLPYSLSARSLSHLNYRKEEKPAVKTL